MKDAGKSEAAQRPLVIGFLDENGSDEYHGVMMEGIFEAARHHNARIIRIGHFTTNDTRRDPAQVRAVHAFTQQFDLDGILFLGWIRAVTMENETAFRKMTGRLPLFSIGVGHSDIPSAIFDGGPYLEQMIQHLMETHGCRRIAFIAPFTPDDRALIYHRIMKRHGFEDPDLYVSEALMAGLPVPERGKRAVQILFDERKLKPDAIISLYNVETEGILKALRERGLRVPRDLAVVSSEDGELGRYGNPAYTTIQFPWWELGRVSCDLFLQHLKQRVSGKLSEQDALKNRTISCFKPVDVPGKLIVRESCGCRPEDGVSVSCTFGKKIPFLQMKDKDWHQMAVMVEKESQIPEGSTFDVQLMMNGLMRGLKTGDRSFFSDAVMTQVARTIPFHEEVSPQKVLSLLRQALLPHVMDTQGLLLAAEDLFMLAGAHVAELEMNAWGSRERLIKRINRELEEAGQQIIRQYTMPGLADVLEHSLMRLGIPDCLVVLSDMRSEEEDRFERCISAFFLKDGQRISINQTEPAKASEVIRRHVTLRGEAVGMVANLLHVESQISGFVLYRPGPLDERIYRALSYHISTALSGIFLMERLEQSFLRLVENAHKEGMVHASNGVLHNIRNILGSVGTTVHRMREVLEQSPLKDLEQVAELLDAAEADPERFLQEDRRANMLLDFLVCLKPGILEYGQEMKVLTKRLQEKNRNIREMLSSQLSDRVATGLSIVLDGSVVMDEALDLSRSELRDAKVVIQKGEMGRVKVRVQHAKFVHALMNVVKNACEAMRTIPEEERVLRISVERDGLMAVFRIQDSGEGISEDKLTAIFSHGFTTKQDGHGFGLHTSANDLTSMGGEIVAFSEGVGSGATFVLRVPLAGSD